MDIDLKQLKELMRSLKQFDISELELEKNGERIKLCRSVESGVREYSVAPSLVGSIPPPSAVSASIAPPPSTSAIDDSACFFVTSPFVGTFYASSTPGSDPFVKVGSEIKPGQTLCIVEAMKLMNEIEAEASGTVVEVLRDNGKPVEYGDRLFKVKKS
jgi:acetyl-CoA carboxylase biotin carboxyl carrier protein